MVKVTRRRLISSCLMLCFAAAACPATADDSVDLAMATRIGLIEYCAKQGLLTPEVASAATRRVKAGRTLVPLASRASDDAFFAREEAGRNGKWGARGVPVTDLARTFGQTLAQYCAEQAE